MHGAIGHAVAGVSIVLAILSAGCQSDHGSTPTTSPPNTTAPSMPHSTAAMTPTDTTTLQPNERGFVYFYTKSRKVFCAVDDERVSCQYPMRTNRDGVRSNGVTFTRDGSVDYVIGDADVRPDLTLDYKTYRAFGWTIVAADDDSLAFRYDATGHGIHVSIDKVTTY